MQRTWHRAAGFYIAVKTRQQKLTKSSGHRIEDLALVHWAEADAGEDEARQPGFKATVGFLSREHLGLGLLRRFLGLDD